MKPIKKKSIKKIPSFVITFIGFFVFAILHNAVDALLHIEEAVFFLTSIGLFLSTPILLIIWIIKMIKKLNSKK